ncbi:hypothetical protein OH77DRAFT_1280789 [Trametes cingulata]|nr:hypothetical protein OH77DRAFT_1280789 [Trametes cingulata]
MILPAGSQSADAPDAQLLALIERVEARTRDPVPSSPDNLDRSGDGSGEPEGLQDPTGTTESASDAPLGPEATLDSPTDTTESSIHRRQRSRSVFESEYEPGLRSSSAVTAANISDLSQRLKRARRLGPQSETDLDIFFAAQPIAREAQQYAVALECRDMLKTMTL